MVTQKKPMEYCIDPYKPIAREYNLPGYTDTITEPNFSPSLFQMIQTATVGSMPGNSSKYSYPDLGEDDEAHDHPDYEKLNLVDPVEKQIFVDNFLSNPNNYEKEKTTSAEVTTSEQKRVERLEKEAEQSEAD